MAAALVMVCAPVVGLRVPSCCRSPSRPHRINPIGPLLRTCSRCQSLPVGSPFPSSRKQTSPRVCVWDLKNKQSRAGSVQSAASSLVDVLSPSSFVVEPSLLSGGAVRRYRSLVRGGACLRPRTSRLSIASLPLLPEKYAGIVGVRT